MTMRDPISYGPTRKISVRDINRLLVDQVAEEEGVVWLDSDLLVEISDEDFYGTRPRRTPPPPRRRA